MGILWKSSRQKPKEQFPRRQIHKAFYSLTASKSVNAQCQIPKQSKNLAANTSVGNITCGKCRIAGRMQSDALLGDLRVSAAKKVKSPRQKRFGKISRVRLAIGRKPLSDCNFGKKIAVRCVDFTKLTSFLSQATSSSYSTHCWYYTYNSPVSALVDVTMVLQSFCARYWQLFCAKWE